MSRICTLLPIETFRQLLGWNPLHFWQLSNQTYAPLTDACSTLIREYAWQNAGASGRSDIYEAIQTAEQRLKNYLQFSPAPHYLTEALDVGCLQHGYGAYQGYGQPPFFKLGEGRVSRIATETVTLVDGAVVPNYSDEDGDGLDDTFTLIVTDSTTDPADIEVYFASGDQLPPYNSANDLCRWQIRPVTATRTDANTITIQGARWLVVRPAKYEGFLSGAGYNNDAFGNLNSSGALDPQEPSNFVSQLAVYKRVVSAANQASLIYTNADGSESSYAVNVTIADRRTSQIALRIAGGGGCPCTCGYSFWNPYGQLGAYQQVSYPLYPSVRFEVNYRAGEELNEWQTIVTRLALAELKKRICACDDANAEIYFWQQDLARAGGVTEEQFRIGNSQLDNPLGTRRGQIYAWERIVDREMLRGVRIG